MKRILCWFGFHDWYIVDYVLGMENGHVWNIKECDRCRKTEWD